MVKTRATAKKEDSTKVEVKKEQTEESSGSDSEYEMATSGNIFNSIDARRPDPLCFDGNVSENWRVFKQNFDVYSIAIELDDRKESQKIGIFLNACGPEAIEIYNTLSLTDEQKKNFKTVVEAFETYCTPKKNEVYEAFRFNSRKQQEGETFDSYLLDLRKLVKSCGYKDSDRMMRDNIVVGTNFG